MSYSLIIPTRNRPVDLQYSLNSIIKQTVLPDELIIVDASSENIGAQNLKSTEAIVGDITKLIYIKSSPGVNKQRNLGASNASSDIIFFLDDDVVLEEDYSEKILEIYSLKGNLNLGGVQGCILNYYNQSWTNRFYKKLFFMTRASVNEKSRFLPSLGYVFIYKPNNIIEVEAMPSLICSYYRDIFNQFRFDEMFERCTDLELSYRVSRQYKLYQTPYAIATHHHSEKTHLNIRNLNKLYVIYSYKLLKKFLSGHSLNTIAYCWSIIGEMILSSIKSIRNVNPDSIAGSFEGIIEILKGIDNNKKYES